MKEICDNSYFVSSCLVDDWVGLNIAAILLLSSSLARQTFAGVAGGNIDFDLLVRLARVFTGLLGAESVAIGKYIDQGQVFTHGRALRPH